MSIPSGRDVEAGNSQVLKRIGIDPIIKQVGNNQVIERIGID